MDIAALEDFASDAASAIAKFNINFILSTDQFGRNDFIVDPLHWQSIGYGEAEIANVPDDRRGLYAFAVCKTSTVLPPHSYVLYIGIAGRKSDRSLRARYRDYLNEKKVLKRERIARMIGTWHTVLRFYFASVDNAVTSDQLEELEKQLNSTLLPPFAEGDLEAGIKQQRRAFR
ncbi:hypothetical protein L7D45_18100 [Brucella pseudogrignonensis]|uniref:hypothetical protein n=1 Tax=Brucella pseudogrignonensis TaxID=419475 RepID=UPI001EDA16C0|nr:hypothetical protein [Brucella pseudogrignonensis]UKK94115.1 hypothetical protein L7D45_18100 [Brucella pseudogrignonensis]